MITRKNVDDMCRLCAGETKDGVDIYCPEVLDLEEKIIHCLRIEVSKTDMLPKKICCPCQSRLEESHRFQEQASRVQKALELLVQMNGAETRFLNDTEILKDNKLEDEFDVKGEIEDLPLDVVIESETDGKIKSLDLSRCENFVTDGVSPTISEKRGKNGLDEKDWLKLQQHARAASNLPSGPREGEVSDKSNENIKIRTNISHSLTNYGSHVLDATEVENLSETAEEEEEEENEINKSSKEWKKQWGIKCNKCDESFSYRSEFDKHYKNDHNKNPAYTCSYCNKTIEKYSTFRSHCYRHVTEGRYRCEQCGKGFGLSGALRVHTLAKHSDAQKPFMCEQCGKGFATRPGLNAHLLTHRARDLGHQEFPCADCGKVLRTRGGLAAHMLAHRMGRRFLCDSCGCSFTQKANLQQHQRLRHSGERPFVCPVPSCSKRFAEKSHLNRHYSFHSEKRPFRCTVCLKMYKTERCLKAHAMVHSEVRPYVCSYCNKGFLSSTRLKQHVNIHTGERPFACQHCERKFTNYPNWLKHNRRRHKDSNPKASLALAKSSAQGQHKDNTASKLEETCLKSSNVSSVDAIHEYAGKARTDELQHLPQTPTPHQGSLHPMMDHTSFPLSQTFPHQLISMHISQSHVLQL